MLASAAGQRATGYSGAHPDYVTYANFWDARWYEFIAIAGYPTTLPLDAMGHVSQNAWAFLPVYPLLVGGIAVLTNASWATVAVVVSLLAGWGFAVVLHRLLAERIPEREATWAVAFVVFAPASPLFGVGYAESLFLLLLALALLMLMHRSYALLAAILVALAFTRPGALAFAVTIGIVALVRWRNRARDPFPVAERLVLAALAVWTTALGFAWALIADLVTGSPGAYIDTELAWRAGYIGRTELIPGTAWFQGAHWWFGDPWTYLLPIAAIAAFVLVVQLPATRRLGVEPVAWIVGYALYLFLVFFPQSSTVRLLAPMFPLAGALAAIRSSRLKFAILLFGVIGQVWWVAATWQVNGADWTPP